MPKNLSLESNLFGIQKSKEIYGAEVPWEVRSYQADYESAVSEGGCFDLTDWNLIEMKGPDTTDFLSRMSTVNFRDFNSSFVQHGAFLTGRGLVVSMGMLQQTPNAYHFLISPG